MTAILNGDHGSDMRSELQVWRCAACRCVHLSKGQVLLTFTPEEFTSFTQIVVECYSSQILFENDRDSAENQSQDFQLINGEVN